MKKNDFNKKEPSEVGKNRAKLETFRPKFESLNKLGKLFILYSSFQVQFKLSNVISHFPTSAPAFQLSSNFPTSARTFHFGLSFPTSIFPILFQTFQPKNFQLLVFFNFSFPQHVSRLMFSSNIDPYIEDKEFIGE